MPDRTIRHTVKDSVFTNLFKDPKYTVQLYKALHPEDKDVSENMIEIISIRNILVNGQYNDLGFMVGGRLIILAEAQTTWSENILIRMLLYIAKTYNEYIDSRNIYLYGSKKADIPRPELFVIYTGSKKISRDYISLSEDFFGAQTDVDIKIRIISDSEKDDIIYQYISFTKVLDEKIRTHGRTKEAIIETIKICKDKNILREYLSKREREVHDIMFTLFDEERIIDLAIQDAVQDTEKRSRAEGKAEGRAEGLAEALKINVFNMLRRNKSDEFIIDALEISSDKLQSLKKEFAQA